MNWLVCILQEKVGSGLVAVEPCVQRTPALVLLAMNTVLIQLKTGTVDMDQFSRSTLMRNSWETQLMTRMTSTPETWIGLGQVTVPAPVTPAPLHTTNMMCVVKKYTGYGRNELGEENCDFDTEPDWCKF